MSFIKKVEALLDFKFGEFPRLDDLPSDFTFDLRHFDENPIYIKKFAEPVCGLFSLVKVSKSLRLTTTSFIEPDFATAQIPNLESFLKSLSEIYGSDEKSMLYLLDEEKEKISMAVEWAGRYWKFDERYNMMNVSLSLNQMGLSLCFYKFLRPWLEFDDDDDDDFYLSKNSKRQKLPINSFLIFTLFHF
ncbi:hypothetical protein [Algoriphagus yeomjeoni]|uniref:Uncharacterized protein n=1 Tax=Algoriphagus yeomjeoni TaxID=291403 RepID=A0A327PQW7_9BACT|nr:hypothetical protein [Algoriphagus yeomjeoni]RAI94143.1 hypothetical protein LV83_01050 [Algoriphagus yeomjeoni]